VSIRVMSLIWDAYPGGGGSELLALLALADWSVDAGRQSRPLPKKLGCHGRKRSALFTG
jgi:hypothetical protein